MCNELLFKIRAGVLNMDQLWTLDIAEKRSDVELLQLLRALDGEVILEIKLLTELNLAM